jgi:hypothetical protein
MVQFACSSGVNELSQWTAFDIVVDSNSYDPNPYKLRPAIEKARDENPGYGGQLAAWEFSYVGEYREVLASWDGNRRNVETVSDFIYESFTQVYNAVDAVEYIHSKSKPEQIVIINEAHHMPSHRVFTRSLLKGLYDEGFRYFGLETLGPIENNDPDLHARKYPKITTGYYSKEPQFGDLIREALKIGYTIFDYEAESGMNGKEREIEQAKNIQNFINTHPDGKFIIHCGFAHAYEGEYASWEKAMAGRLEEYTGINPLSINQTVFSEKSKRTYENPLYQKLDVEKPVVYTDSNGDSYNGDGGKSHWCDIYVFHPRTRWINSRPHWLFDHGKSPVEIDVSVVTDERPVLVKAYPEGEDIHEAVPIDVVMVEEEETTTYLALSPGKYTIVVQGDSSAWKSYLGLQ